MLSAPTIPHPEHSAKNWQLLTGYRIQSSQNLIVVKRSFFFSFLKITLFWSKHDLPHGTANSM